MLRNSETPLQGFPLIMLLLMTLEECLDSLLAGCSLLPELVAQSLFLLCLPGQSLLLFLSQIDSLLVFLQHLYPHLRVSGSK